jgi:branched-chain amino acid transport system permease protein
MNLTPRSPTALATARVTRWTVPSIVTVSLVVAAQLVLVAGPLFLSPNSVERLTTLFIYGILALMWNALAGYAGLLSVGHQAFFGLGAYAAIRLADWGVSPYLALLLAATLVGALSVPISAFMLRLRGGEFAIGMWVVAALCHLLVNLDNLIQGETGTSLIALQAYAAEDRRNYTYWAALGTIAALGWLVFVMLRGKMGTAAQAIIVASQLHHFSAQDLLQRAMDGLHDLHGAGGRHRHLRRPDHRRGCVFHY